MATEDEAHTASIALSLTEDYAPSWGTWEGVRELVQNFHDGCLDHGGPVQWEHCDIPENYGVREQDAWRMNAYTRAPPTHTCLRAYIVVACVCRRARRVTKCARPTGAQPSASSCTMV